MKNKTETGNKEEERRVREQRSAELEDRINNN